MTPYFAIYLEDFYSELSSETIEPILYTVFYCIVYCIDERTPIDGYEYTTGTINMFLLSITLLICHVFGTLFGFCNQPLVLYFVINHWSYNLENKRKEVLK